MSPSVVASVASFATGRRGAVLLRQRGEGADRRRVRDFVLLVRHARVARAQPRPEERPYHGNCSNAMTAVALLYKTTAVLF